jgi:flagellar biosynthesis component FlhA
MLRILCLVPERMSNALRNEKEPNVVFTNRISNQLVRLIIIIIIIIIVIIRPRLKMMMVIIMTLTHLFVTMASRPVLLCSQFMCVCMHACMYRVTLNWATCRQNSRENDELQKVTILTFQRFSMPEASRDSFEVSAHVVKSASSTCKKQRLRGIATMSLYPFENGTICQA